MDKTLTLIEQRLQNLEVIVNGKLGKKKVATSVALKGSSLYETIEKNTKKMKEVEGEDNQLVSFFQSLAKIDEILNSTLSKERNIPRLSKLALILSEKDNIYSTIDNLQKFQNLQEYIDSPFFHSLSSHIKKLDKLKELEFTKAENNQAIVKDFEVLVTLYNDFISAISQKFVLFDQILSSLETKHKTK